MTKYALPDLPYDYGALEPHISAKIMQLHHDKHHKTYVDGANQTLEALSEARDKGDFARIAALEHQLAFHVSGHVLHSIFWKNMSPNGGGEPIGALASAIDRDFGGLCAAAGRSRAGRRACRQRGHARRGSWFRAGRDSRDQPSARRLDWC